MTIVQVAAAKANVAGANGGTTSGIVTTGAALLVINVAQFSGAATKPTPTDSLGLTWNALTAQSQALEAYSRIFWAANPTGNASHTFSISGTSIFASLQVAGFSGVITALPFNKENGATSLSAPTTSTGSSTPDQDNSLVITGMCVNKVATSPPYTVDGGFTITNVSAYNAGVSEGGGLAYLIQTSAAAANPQWGTWSSLSQSGAATLAVFKPAPAGAAQELSLTMTGAGA